MFDQELQIRVNKAVSKDNEIIIHSWKEKDCSILCWSGHLKVLLISEKILKCCSHLSLIWASDGCHFGVNGNIVLEALSNEWNS